MKQKRKKRKNKKMSNLKGRFDIFYFVNNIYIYTKL